MSLKTIPLKEFGLVEVADAAAMHGRSVRSVQNWIVAGQIPAVVVGQGKSVVYLLRLADVKKFTPPARGRPVVEDEQ